MARLAASVVGPSCSATYPGTGMPRIRANRSGAVRAQLR